MEREVEREKRWERGRREALEREMGRERERSTTGTRGRRLSK